MAWNFQSHGAPCHQQQVQHYQQNHPQYTGQGQSQHYGNYGNFYQQNVFQTNAWQVRNNLYMAIRVIHTTLFFIR
jgi:hypothetical protein